MTLLSERDSRETGRQEMFQVAVMAETEVGHTVREWNRLVDSTVVMLGQYGNRAQAAGTRRVEAGNTLSPKQAKKQQKKLKKQRRHKKFWFGFKIFMLIALIAILAALVVIYFKFGDDLLKWKMEATDVVENSTADTFRASETSIIYASNKSMIAKLKGDKDSYYLSFDEIPQSVKDAMVVTEDRDFYKHEGVNFWSTAKAAVMLVESKLRHKDISRGGSTITQQLGKKCIFVK